MKHTKIARIDDEALKHLHAVLHEATCVLEHGLGQLGEVSQILAALANGATFRLVVDFDEPARITGQLITGPYPKDLFSATIQIDTDGGAEGSPSEHLQ